MWGVSQAQRLDNFPHTQSNCNYLFDINLAKFAVTKYLLLVFSPLSFVFQDMPPQCEMLSPRQRCLTWKTQRKWGLWQADMHMRARTHIQITANCTSRSCSHPRKHAPKQGRTWISQVVAVFHQLQWEPVLPSTCGAIISWHTYPPLNDFSSSPASHLIKVESLMPFRDPTAFNRIHCHYENEWRQLRTQMFFHIVTESLLMCLVIFTVAASDWRPWLVTRLIMLLILHIAFGFCLCSASPFLTRSLSHRDH